MVQDTNQHAGTCAQRWVLAVALLAIATVSQGVHDIAIEHLGVPFPALFAAPAWLPALRDVVQVAFFVLFCMAARPALDRLPLARAGALVGLFATCLSEAFRVPVIDFFLVNAWIGHAWIDTLVSFIPRIATGFALGFAGLLVARYLVKKSFILVALAVVTAGWLIRFGLAPLAGQLAAALDAAFGVARPGEVYVPPYGPGILMLIYLTFLEPTVAAFFMARFAWPGLPGSVPVRIALFTALILGASGRLTLLLVSSFWVRQPPLWAFLSTGQFFAETLVMAALVASLFTWHANRRAVPDAAVATV